MARIVFDPADFTFICPTEVVGFSKLAKEFAAQGAEILGVSVDSLDSHRAWAEELGGIDYPLLSDEDKTLSRAMGFSMRGREFHPELLSSSIPAAKSVIWSSATLMSDAASRKLCVCLKRCAPTASAPLNGSPGRPRAVSTKNIEVLQASITRAVAQPKLIFPVQRYREFEPLRV
jgi:hypothetical protein